MPVDVERTVHRLEAFSDLVIAFTLSQLALTLRLPEHSHDIIAHPITLFRFVASFALVCSLWWVHHRLFKSYFYPDALSIILNFAFLASTAYVAYSFLLLSTFGDTIALGAYGLSIGAAYSLLAIMLAKGQRDSRLSLDDAQRLSGAQLTQRIALGGVAFLVSSLLAVTGRSDREVLTVWVITGAALIVLGVRHRISRQRREQSAG